MSNINHQLFNQQIKYIRLNNVVDPKTYVF